MFEWFVYTHLNPAATDYRTVTSLKLSAHSFANFVSDLKCPLRPTWSHENMPVAISRRLFFALASSPLLPQRLPDSVLRIIRELGIASRRTRRGCRGGKVAKRARAAKRFLLAGLVNARSVASKPDVITSLLLSADLDLLFITETWLNAQHGEDILLGVCPEGYASFQVPRIGRRGGGTALIHRETIRVNPMSPVFEATTFEHLSASLFFNSVCVRLVVVYRPPSTKPSLFLTEFSAYLEQLVIMTGKLLIVGDFNIHLDDSSNLFSQKFLSTIKSFGLEQHVSDPTHVSGHVLDLVLSRPADRTIADCFVSGLVSDHFVVRCLIRTHRPFRPQKTVSFRKLKSIDLDAFARDLLNLPLFTDPGGDVLSLLEQYNTGTAQILERHAPLQTRKFTIRPDNPWNTEEVRAARRQSRKLERRFKLSKLAIDKEILIASRDNLRRLIESTKVSYLNTKICESVAKKSLFGIVDSFLLKKPGLQLPRHDSLPELLEQFGCHFVRKIASIRSSLDEAELDRSPDLRCPVQPLQSFSLVTVDEIVSLVKNCPAKSSPRDPIPTFLLKKLLHVLASPITKIVNMSLSSGVFPDEMKLALVTPLLKKAGLSPENLDNYRPVSNLSFLSKLIERVVARQLSFHLESSGLYVPVQSAYRPNHSTETALLKILNDLLLVADSGDAAILALLDQSAAFDTIDHEILLERIQLRFGISDLVLTWIRSYLSNRSQSVCVAGMSSSPVSLRWGVPQGSVLGPTLFILYSSPIHDIPPRHSVSDHYYADDTQLYRAFSLSADGREQHEAFLAMAGCIAEAKRWMTANKLKLNENKTEALVVYASSARLKPLDTPLGVGEGTVKLASTARNLGVILDNHLSLDDHVRSICKKAFFHLHRISRIRKYLTQSAIRQLVHAFVTSQLDYGNSLLAGLPAVRLDRLQRVQNAAARLITGSRKFDPITSHLVGLHWLPVRQRIEFKIAMLTFRSLDGSAPKYLSDLIEVYRPARALRSSNSLDLVVPPTRLKAYGDRSFKKMAPLVWNSLPLSVRRSKSLSEFRSALKTHLFRTAYSLS